VRNALGDRVDGLGTEQLDRADGRVDVTAPVLDLVGEPQGFAMIRATSDSTAQTTSGGGNVILGDHRQQAIA